MESPSHPDRGLTAVLLAALGLLAVLMVSVWVEDDWHHLVDAAIYVLTASSLAAGEGYTYLGEPFFARPPGLPWLLSHVVGQGPDWDWGFFNQLIQLFAAGSLLTLLVAMRQVHGWLAAALVTLLFAVNPLTVEAHNEILAEFPYLFLFWAGLWLAAGRHGGHQPTLTRAVTGALLLAAACYFRTVGLLVLPGLALTEFLRRSRRGEPVRRWQGVLVLAIVVGLQLPWMLHARGAAAEAPRPSTQLLVFDYSTALFHTDPSDPDSPLVDLDGWIERVVTNAEDISRTVTFAFLGGPPNEYDSEFGLEAPILAALLAAAMLYTALTRRSVLDGYMVAYVVLLLVYFTFADRLLMPLVPCVISSIIYCLERVGRFMVRPEQSVDPRGGLIALVALGLLAVSLLRLPEARSQTSNRRLFARDDDETAEWVNENLPEDAVLLHEKGAILTVLTGRTTYTYRNLPGPWPEGCPDVDYAIFSPRPRREATEPLVAAKAKGVTKVPFRWHNRPSAIRIYDLSGPDHED